ncbi:MAG: hypothetical protein LBT40_16575 [Deltaproteobacteria bacterium]|nr:hypothetical protein [Deltaproteobacteria bacterium]
MAKVAEEAKASARTWVSKEAKPSRKPGPAVRLCVPGSQGRRRCEALCAG